MYNNKIEYEIFLNKERTDYGKIKKCYGGGGQLSKPLAERVSSLLANFKYTKEKLERKKAFTLAEVLITLGIIGVVAAISIPTLMQNTNRKDTVSKVKKGFNTFSNAFALAVATEGNINKWGVSGTSTKEDAILIAEKVKPYLNIAKDCGVDKTGCIYSGMYKTLNNNDSANYQSTDVYYKLLLNDGTAIIFKDGGNPWEAVWAYFDINGEKGPNKMGIDFFAFKVDKEGKILPIADPSRPERGCNKNGTGLTCSSYILENSNMDYLDE